jgi:hypothetical protein
MTSRSEFLTRLSVVIAALMLSTLGHTPPARGDDPPECIGDWPNIWPNPDSCYPDILCDEYADFWDVRRGIVHIYGPDIYGTGVLINNASCDDFGQNCGVPYLLTAHHVVSDQKGKMTNGERNTLDKEAFFTFGLEAAWCGGPTAGGAIAVKGASVVEEAWEKDLVLLQLNTKLPEELSAYYVGWGNGTLDEQGNLDEQAVVIGHPCLAPKRIAISQPGAVKFQEVVHKSIYQVDWWEVGGLAYGFSGSPLLDMDSLSLHGVYTDTTNPGVQACFHPEQRDQDIFTALPSILDTLPKFVDGDHSSIDSYDSNPENLIDGTVEDGKYYGKGVKTKITAKVEVVLINEFYADKGSEIVIEINP